MILSCSARIRFDSEVGQCHGLKTLKQIVEDGTLFVHPRYKEFIAN